MRPTHRSRRIWFCQTEYVAAHPGSLKRLQDLVGLTTIMPESPVCHTSGFSVSEKLARRGPFEDWRRRPEAWPRGAEGVYPPVAGIVSGFDDGPLLRVIEACQDAGVEVWGHIGLWSYGGEVYPEYALQDLEGRPLDRRYQRWASACARAAGRSTSGPATAWWKRCSAMPSTASTWTTPAIPPRPTCTP